MGNCLPILEHFPGARKNVIKTNGKNGFFMISSFKRNYFNMRIRITVYRKKKVFGILLLTDKIVSLITKAQKAKDEKYYNFILVSLDRKQKKL